MPLTDAEAATDALTRRHRDALDRCKATIQLAGEMTREHEVGYRAAVAQLNEASIVAGRILDHPARMRRKAFFGVDFREMSSNHAVARWCRTHSREYALCTTK